MNDDMDRGRRGAQWGCVCADVTPIFFMWEKLVGTHHKPSYIRLPSRLPVGEQHLTPSWEGCKLCSSALVLALMAGVLAQC
jgi:hypothetical protein